MNRRYAGDESSSGDLVSSSAVSFSAMSSFIGLLNALVSHTVASRARWVSKTTPGQSVRKDKRSCFADIIMRSLQPDNVEWIAKRVRIEYKGTSMLRWIVVV